MLELLLSVEFREVGAPLLGLLLCQVRRYLYTSINSAGGLRRQSPEMSCQKSTSLGGSGLPKVEAVHTTVSKQATKQPPRGWRTTALPSPSSGPVAPAYSDTFSVSESIYASIQRLCGHTCIHSASLRAYTHLLSVSPLREWRTTARPSPLSGPAAPRGGGVLMSLHTSIQDP